jgi:hypothetical protein
MSPKGSAGVPPDAHEWVSFEDPDEDRTWVIDVTFLESAWNCIFGRGCQGVLTEPAPELVQGCCSYGAHFTGDADAERVLTAASTLTPAQWQFRSRGMRPDGPLRRTKSGEAITRLVGGACIFLNRPDHEGGAGCALHRAALERGMAPLELKPDVCWQLPLRREDVVGQDGHVTSTLTEWKRRHWGRGGADFAWWCTEAPEAFSASMPVYRSMEAELTAMTSPEVYTLITDYLAMRRKSRQATWVPHPALRVSPPRRA